MTLVWREVWGGGAAGRGVARIFYFEPNFKVSNVALTLEDSLFLLCNIDSLNNPTDEEKNKVHMTSQVQASGCHFELKHLPVHFFVVVIVVVVLLLWLKH